MSEESGVPAVRIGWVKRWLIRLILGVRFSTQAAVTRVTVPKKHGRIVPRLADEIEALAWRERKQLRRREEDGVTILETETGRVEIRVVG